MSFFIGFPSGLGDYFLIRRYRGLFDWLHSTLSINTFGFLKIFIEFMLYQYRYITNKTLSVTESSLNTLSFHFNP